MEGQGEAEEGWAQQEGDRAHREEPGQEGEGISGKDFNKALCFYFRS